MLLVMDKQLWINKRHLRVRNTFLQTTTVGAIIHTWRKPATFRTDQQKTERSPLNSEFMIHQWAKTRQVLFKRIGERFSSFESFTSISSFVNFLFGLSFYQHLHCSVLLSSTSICSFHTSPFESAPIASLFSRVSPVDHILPSGHDSPSFYQTLFTCRTSLSNSSSRISPFLDQNSIHFKQNVKF